MHQISPAPSNKAPARHATAPSSMQSALTAHLHAFTCLESDLDAVVHEACRTAAKGVGARFAGVLQYRADEGVLVLQAGIGWPAHMIGRTRVTADLGTAAGLAWITGQLVHFRQSHVIGRFRVPDAIVGQKVDLMVSIPIRGLHKEAFGVLEVGTSDAGEFTPHDLTFLQRTADSVAVAVDLYASQTGRTEQAKLFAERDAALAGRLDTALADQRPARVSYQQDRQCGTG